MMTTSEATVAIQKGDLIRAHVWGVEQTGFVLYVMFCGTAMVEFGGITGKRYVHTSVMTKVED